MSDTIESSLLSSAVTVFRYHKDLADRAIAQVPDQQMHESLDSNTNSIVVIMKHIAGNLLSRFTDFLSTDGEKSWRDRDQEFVDTFSTRDELLDYWERGWKCLFETLDGLSDEDLSKTVLIRGQPHSVPLAIQRSLAHISYHVGQIVIVARIHAKENWETLTIPRGESTAYNERVWDGTHYGKS